MEIKVQKKRKRKKNGGIITRSSRRIMMRIVNGHVKCFESCLSRQVCRSLRFDLLRHSPTEGGSSQKDDALKLNRKCWPPCSESSTCILIIHTSWLQYIHGDRGHPSLLFLFFCFLLLLLFVFVFPPHPPHILYVHVPLNVFCFHPVY